MGNCQAVAKLIGFVQTQPDLEDEDEQEMQEALRGLREKLGVRALEKYLEQGKTMTLEQVLELVFESADSSLARPTKTSRPETPSLNS
jgi:hypothetical protein